MNDPNERIQIVSKSLHLYERLLLLKKQSGNSVESAHEKESIKQWKHQCAAGDSEKFEKRLVQDAISEWEARAVLNLDNLNKAKLKIPSWYTFYEAVRNHAKQLQPDEIFRNEHNKHAFFHVVYPFYRHALQLVTNYLYRSDIFFHDIPLTGACNYLKNLLTECAAQAVYLEFNIFKAQHETGLSALIRKALNPGENDKLYREFIQEFYASKWDSFFFEYAILTRQLSQAAENWVSSMCMFLERYMNDLPALEETFNNGQSFGTINKINFGLSDRHNEGKTTAIISYDSGKKLVYKPKPLSTECVLKAIIDWVNQDNELIGLKAVPIIDKADYGWQQFVANTGCHSDDEIQRFYIRAGYLMAIVYIMEGYDFHYENLIADGEFPYLIDTETIFNPYKEMELAKTGKLNAAHMASETVYYSVLRTGMLPNWNIRKEGDKKDISGFGGHSDGNGQLTLRRWINVGTDDIRIEQVETGVKKMGNQPFVEGREPTSSDKYVNDIVQGFHQMYEHIVNNKIVFCQLIKQWEHVIVRFVRKPTRMYSELIAKLSEPEFLRNGMDWSIGTEIMARLYLAADLKNRGQWNLLREEYEALIQLDIPYFRVNANALDVKNGKDQLLVNAYFTTKCFDRIIEKTDRLDANDLALQERYIRYAFYARQAKSFHEDARSAALSNTIQKPITINLPEISAENCVKIAEVIANDLEQEALKASDGSMAWIALEYLKEADVFQFKPISYNFYSGAAGIGFFFAALFKATGETNYYNLTKASMMPIMRIIDEELNELIRYSGIGGGVGLGSLIYSFTSIADFLQTTEFGETATIYALKCAEFINPEILETDKKYDLMFGSSGLLLSLVKLYRLTDEQAVFDRILLTADYLLRNCQNTAQGENLVPTYGNRAITGISHGASGVALALLRAFECTGDERYKLAATAQLDFEEKMYDPEAANYPTYKSTEDEKVFITSWCHGAPGIGLSRLMAYKVIQEEDLLQQINKNLAVTSAFSLDHLDHLCCGNFGRLDIELEHAKFFSDEKKLQNIRRNAQYIVNRFYENDGFRLFIDAPIKVFSPGLFVGATGIAYSLLRIAFPDKLPSVLAYE